MPLARLGARAEGGGAVLTGSWLLVAAVFEGWPGAEPGILLGHLVHWDYEYYAYLAPAPHFSSHCLSRAAAFERGPGSYVSLFGEEMIRENLWAGGFWVVVVI